MTETSLQVPDTLLALELAHRTEKTAADARGKDSCHYQADRLARQVANHPWLTRHPGRSPERRAARKLLRETADRAQAAMEAEAANGAAIIAEYYVEQWARHIATRETVQ